MPPKFYNLADQKLFENYQYIPQEKYRLGLNLPTEDEVVTDEGIVNTDAFANAGGGGDFNTITDFSYTPYVSNTSENTANTFAPNYDYGITSDPVEILDYMNYQSGNYDPTGLDMSGTATGRTDIFDINQTGDPALNEESIMVQGSNPYGENEEEDTGFFSNMLGKGKKAALTSLGLSAILPPQLSIPLGILKGFASKSSGPKSLQSKYSVDNAGYGNTGMRDEFGLFTGQRKDGLLGIFGEPTGSDYTTRMAERINELQDFYNSDKIQEKYGLGNIDLENDVLDEATYNKIKNINSTYAKQVLEYPKR